MKRPSDEPRTEAQLSAITANYLRSLAIPFNVDVLAGVKLTMRQGAMAKKQGKTKSWPDIFIAVARHGYHGLYIEQKKWGERVFKVRSPNEYANDHILKQALMLHRLESEGYKAVFAVGWVETKWIIDNYLSVA